MLRLFNTVLLCLSPKFPRNARWIETEIDRGTNNQSIKHLVLDRMGKLGHNLVFHVCSCTYVVAVHGFDRSAFAMATCISVLDPHWHARFDKEM